ncbi:MAG: hypothetical protein ACP5N3_00355 [Candidatus Nanoarchaeia archaeon]
MKDNSIRKTWLIDYESLKKEVSVRFGEEYFHSFHQKIGMLAQYHYDKKKSLLLGKDKELYDFLRENGHNPYKVYRWCLLERVPETLRFQLKEGTISQKTALNTHFKSRHETNSQVCISIKLQGMQLVRGM